MEKQKRVHIAPKPFGTPMGAKSRVCDLPEAYLCNAFSLAMLQDGEALVQVQPITIEQVRSFYLQSAVGHQGAADYYAQLLGFEVACNRINLKLKAGHILIVGQIQGRLPEGTILESAEMPPIQWLKVEIHETERQRQSRFQAAKDAEARREASWQGNIFEE